MFWHSNLAIGTNVLAHKKLRYCAILNIAFKASI